MGDRATALTYLNKIPQHRNADTYSQATLDNILLERRKELAMEGHYYWTLLRYGKDIDRNMRPGLDAEEVHKEFGNFKLAWPIPIGELDANPNMKQNQGYTGG